MHGEEGEQDKSIKVQSAFDQRHESYMCGSRGKEGMREVRVLGRREQEKREREEHGVFCVSLLGVGVWLVRSEE